MKSKMLWAVAKGDEAWQEQIITTNETKIEAAKAWAKSQGFHSFRIAEIDSVPEKPDFIGTIKLS